MLENAISEIDAGQAEATKVRQEEHAEFLKASKDFKDSATAVAKAIAVLSEYYNSAAFVQVRAFTTPFNKNSFQRVPTALRKDCRDKERKRTRRNAACRHHWVA